jgi:hypothetical protein
MFYDSWSQRDMGTRFLPQEPWSWSPGYSSAGPVETRSLGSFLAKVVLALLFAVLVATAINNVLELFGHITGVRDLSWGVEATLTTARTAEEVSNLGLGAAWAAANINNAARVW